MAQFNLTDLTKRQYDVVLRMFAGWHLFETIGRDLSGMSDEEVEDFYDSDKVSFSYWLQSDTGESEVVNTLTFESLLGGGWFGLYQGCETNIGGDRGWLENTLAPDASRAIAAEQNLSVVPPEGKSEDQVRFTQSAKRLMAAYEMLA